MYIEMLILIVAVLTAFAVFLLLYFIVEVCKGEKLNKRKLIAGGVMVSLVTVFLIWLSLCLNVKDEFSVKKYKIHNVEKIQVAIIDGNPLNVTKLVGAIADDNCELEVCELVNTARFGIIINKKNKYRIIKSNKIQ